MGSTRVVFVSALALGATLAVPAVWAAQEFTLDEARTRIERLEARVAALEEGRSGANDDRPSSAPIASGTVSGEVVLVGWDSFTGEGAGDERVCSGKGGLSDIGVGTSVRVLDGEGRVIAVGRLEGGDIDRDTCRLIWEVDVPNSDFYEFRIADRGGPTFNRDELEALGWRVELAIGE